MKKQIEYIYLNEPRQERVNEMLQKGWQIFSIMESNNVVTYHFVKYEVSNEDV